MKDFEMDLLTIADRFEESKPTLMVTNSINDDVMFEWRTPDGFRWLRLSFFKTMGENYVARLDLEDEEFSLSDCSSIAPNIFDLLKDINDTLEITNYVSSMPMQAIFQKIIAILDELIDLEL